MRCKDCEHLSGIRWEEALYYPCKKNHGNRHPLEKICKQDFKQKEPPDEQI